MTDKEKWSEREGSPPPHPASEPAVFMGTGAIAIDAVTILKAVEKAVNEALNAD